MQGRHGGRRVLQSGARLHLRRSVVEEAMVLLLLLLLVLLLVVVVLELLVLLLLQVQVRRRSLRCGRHDGGR